MSKLTIAQINIIGISIAIVLALILFLGPVRLKGNEAADVERTAKSTQEQNGTADAVRKNQTLLKKTQAQSVLTKQQWAVSAVKYMPDLPYDDKTNPLSAYMFKPASIEKGLGVRDLPTAWGEWITAWYDAQRNLGVARVPGMQFPIPALADSGGYANPNAIASLDHLTFPQDGRTWTVNLEAKSFDQAMAHLRRFNSIQRHGMPVISNVTLSGQSPNLELSYEMALYVIPNSPPPAEDPFINSSTGTAGGGGMPGMGGGMQGMGGRGSMGGMTGAPMGAPAGAAGRPPQAGGK